MAQKIERFEDLECWKSARQLVKTIYALSKEGELSKDWDFRSQLRRAAISIMNNIPRASAGCLRFYDIAQASANEVKSMLSATKNNK